MKYDREVAAAIARWAPAFGVRIDPYLVHGILEAESRHGAQLWTNEGGGRYSWGPMMVLDATAKALGYPQPSALIDPPLGIQAGVKYLGGLLKQFRGDVARAVASYNAGPSSPDASGRYRNQPYVDRVLSYQRLYALGGGAAPPAAAGLIVGTLLLVLLARRRRAFA